MIPRNYDDLSVEFFSSILGCPVASFHLDESVGIFQGNTSVLKAVIVNFEAAITFPPRRLYLKFALPLTDDSAHNVSFTRKLFVEANVYRKEIEFYKYAKQQQNQHESSLLDALVPVYYAEIEPLGGDDHFLLVMGEAGRAFNQLHDTCSLETSLLIVAQLANFHSHFITAFPQNNPEPQMTVCFQPSHHLVAQIVSPESVHLSPLDLLDLCCDELPEKLNDFKLVALAMSKKLPEKESTFSKLLAQIDPKTFISNIRLAFHHLFLNSKVDTLIHGDFRLDNILSSGDVIKFIDFQALHCGNPAYDLAQFIVQSHDEPSAVFDSLLNVYYNTLCEKDPRVGSLISIADLVLATRSAVALQLLMLAFHCAKLKPSIDASTGLLPESLDRFMDLIALIIERALKAYIKI